MKKFIVLRIGELFLKGANRAYFERTLQDNIHRALGASKDIKIQRGQGRMFIECAQEKFDDALQKMHYIFGISSFSPAVVVPKQLDAISNTAIKLLQPIISKGNKPSFKVETQRSDKQFPLKSPEINRDVGAAIVKAFDLPVDIHNPELLVGVEVGQVQTFVYLERIQGPGGLPVGVSGKIMLLLSGGIDSPVAGYLLQKRGCILRAVHFHSPPYTSERAKDKVLQLSEILAKAQHKLTLDCIEFTKIQKMIRDNAPHETVVVLYRRMMMRIASALAKRNQCIALGTGENLGQVASQTLENIACIEETATLPVLRPLIANDKQQTIDLARRIGTYPISTLPHEDCCSLFVPKHPATKLSIDKATYAETQLDIENLVQIALDSVESIEITAC